MVVVVLLEVDQGAVVRDQSGDCLALLNFLCITTRGMGSSVCMDM